MGERVLEDGLEFRTRRDEDQTGRRRGASGSTSHLARLRRARYRATLLDARMRDFNFAIFNKDSGRYASTGKRRNSHEQSAQYDFR